MPDREILYRRHPDPMWVQDPVTLRILDVNDAALGTYGYSRAEFLALSVPALLPAEDLDYFNVSLGASRAGRSTPGVFQHRTKSGGLLFVQATLRALEWEGRPAEMVWVRDMSAFVTSEATRKDLMQRAAGQLEESHPAAIELAEQAANLRTALRLIRMGTWKYEFWSGLITGSAETRVMYAIPPDRPGITFPEFLALVPPEDRAALNATYAAFASSGAPSFEFRQRLVHPDGRTFHVRGVGERVETTEGLALTGAVIDVTHELERDRRLKLLDLSVSRLNDIVLIFDAGKTGADPEAPIVYANPALLRITGLTPNEVIGQPVSQLMHGAAPDIEPEVLETALSGAVSLRSDIQLRARDGRMIPAEVDLVPVLLGSATPSYWVAMIRDMSEKHAAEERARFNETRYEMLARSTQDVVWDWNFETRRIDWNSNFRILAGDPGAPLKSAPTTSWIDRIHPDDRERVTESFFAAANGTAENWSAEYRFLRDDGGVRFVFDRGFASRGIDGKPLRMVGSMVDVTRQREAEARLLQAEKLEALGQVTGGVAHDFNNLLAIIMGNAETLLDRIEDPRSHRLLELIASAAERGRDLTGRLLAFSRRSPMQPVPLDLNVMVQRSSELFSRILRANICVEIETRASPAGIEADPGQLELVLLNLAVNARDAMQASGTLRLATDIAEFEGRQEIVLSITDNGTGMDAETLRRCFEPFYTTKPVGKGVGLGLSMAFGFMAQSGGRLTIESELGRGTCVALHFPVLAASSAAPQGGRSPSSGIIGGNEHVLLVEDDPGVRVHVEQLLAALGYRVTARTTADTAVDYLQNGGKADLLMTDLVMPGSAGVVKLVEVARSHLPGIRVLYTSGYPKALVDADGRLPGDINFLAKPYLKSDLAFHLRQLLDPPTSPLPDQEPEV